MCIFKKDICGYGIHKRYCVDDKGLWIISLDLEAVEMLVRQTSEM